MFKRKKFLCSIIKKNTKEEIVSFILYVNTNTLPFCHTEADLDYWMRHRAVLEFETNSKYRTLSASNFYADIVDLEEDEPIYYFQVKYKLCSRTSDDVLRSVVGFTDAKSVVTDEYIREEIKNNATKHHGNFVSKFHYTVHPLRMTQRVLDGSNNPKEEFKELEKDHE